MIQQTDSECQVALAPASDFSVEQLMQLYNQTRVDYLVPMPMNAARLLEYVQTYDVDLQHSFVALDGDQPLGLAMLGVRPGQTWITRLGVLPGRRRGGVGQILMDALLAATARLGIQHTMLEVIKNNHPAYKLFVRCGFEPVRELLILRRPPGPATTDKTGTARWLSRATALRLLNERQIAEAWTNQRQSLCNAPHMHGISVTLPNGSAGWLVFQKQRFLITRLIMHTTQGDPAAVGRALFAHVYERYPALDTQAENIDSHDRHLAAFTDAGYVESFRRIEMQRSVA